MRCTLREWRLSERKRLAETALVADNGIVC